MDQYAETRLYLARVLPWPQPGDTSAYINVHHTYRPPGADNLIFPGRAVHSIDDAVSVIDFALKKTSDVYACMSSQRTAQEKHDKLGRTYYGAIRNKTNAVALKSLFLDIDLKDGLRGYSSTLEITDALDAFLRVTGLPHPTLIVATGGGVHVYWTIDRVLTPEEWQPLARALAEATKRHGLKCDPQCTVDCVRLLRIPDTFNFKTGVPRPVRLVGEPLNFDYSVERLERALEIYKVSAGFPSSPRSPVGSLKPHNVRQGPPIEGISALAAGIDIRKAPPIQAKHAISECPFLHDAVALGGKDYPEPLWHLTTFMAVFMEDGRTMAHLMGRRHPGYTRESTDRLFDRKIEDQRAKNVGWPACRTISETGAKRCQNCQHFGKGAHSGDRDQSFQSIPITRSDRSRSVWRGW